MRFRVASLKKYGVSEDRIPLLIAQKKCDCCGEEPEKTLHIDHCHSRQVFRGMLCSNCNLMLGQAKDSIQRLEAGKAYLCRFFSF